MYNKTISRDRLCNEPVPCDVTIPPLCDGLCEVTCNLQDIRCMLVKHHNY